MISSIAIEADAPKTAHRDSDVRSDALPSMPISQRGLQMLSRINHLFDAHREQNRNRNALVAAPAQ